MLTTNQIRDLYINYFIKNNHKFLPSASLIPFNDNSLLFVNSGMVPFKDFFTDISIPQYKTVVTCQKSLRAGGKHNDLDNVGYTNCHHTFFEMLGNFSFGEYFKEEAIFYAWEFVTKILNLPSSKLSVTVYYNDNEAASLWKKISGLNDSKILRINSDDNFWSMGNIGPCGPCSEIFYDQGDKFSDDERYLEIWNLVFMQFEKFNDDKIIPLLKPCIDTGMGLERVSAILQGHNDNYQNDVFQHIIHACEKIVKKSLNDNNLPFFKVVADHTRAACFAISDGILPANEGREYVIRRIIRRGMYYAQKLSNQNNILSKLVTSIIESMSNVYPELATCQNKIENILVKEEESFNTILINGNKILENEIKKLDNQTKLFPANVAFKLYDTFGFPVDTTIDILHGHKLDLDIDLFNQYLNHQRQLASQDQKNKNISSDILNKLIIDLSPTEFLGYDYTECNAIVVEIIDNQILIMNQTIFYAEMGGQIGDSGEIYDTDNNLLARVINTTKSYNQVILHHIELINFINVGAKINLKINLEKRKSICINHTATHLLNYSLREILGCNVNQKGSLINDEKLRFDFNYDQQISDNDIYQIELNVNKQITLNSPVNTEIMTYKDAIDFGAYALFNEKYGPFVRVIRIDNNSELCGGTHVASTGEITLFKIIKCMSIASGIKRIEAITHENAVNWVNNMQNKFQSVLKLCDVSSDQIIDRINYFIGLEKSFTKLQLQYALINNFYIKNISNDYVFQVKFLSDFAFKSVLSLVNKINNSVVLVVVKNKTDNMISIAIKDIDKLDALYLLKQIMKTFFNDNKCGGSQYWAQGKVNFINEKILDNIVTYLEKLLMQQVMDNSLKL